MKLRAYLVMLLIVAIWGSTFVVVKAALADASPAIYNSIRMVIAFVFLSILYRHNWRGINRYKILSGALVGLFLTMGYEFQTVGLARTTPSKSAFITGLLVVMVPFLSLLPGLRPAGLQRPGWNAFLGAALAFVGIVLLTVPAVAAHGGGTALTSLLPDLSAINPGDLLTLGGALGFALHTLALSHTSPRIGFQQLAILQIGFSAIFMGISLPFLDHAILHWTPRLVVALLISSIFATSIAFTAQTWAQSILPPTHMAILFTLEPFFAWLTSFLVMGERMTMRPACGALLILAGILITELLAPVARPAPQAVSTTA